jgi:caspase domain-containing protein
MSQGSPSTQGGLTEPRHALLIGIPRCGNDAAFPPIPEDVVRTDITRMARALSQSGYEITVLGVPPVGDIPIRLHVSEQPSRSRCLDEIEDACNRVPEGGTLLIYFSGHGVRIGGADFLVPEDFSRLGSDGRLQTSRLVPVNFSDEASLCRAGTVLCFIDACRNPPAEGGAESGQAVPQLPVGSFVLVRGCAPDEICEWQADNGSVFTRALAHALQRNQSARTLGQVLQATQDRLREQDSVQRPHTVFVGPVAESAIRDTIICEGVRLLDDWRTAVVNARLWTLVDDPEATEPLRTAVRDLISSYGKQVGQSRDQLNAAESLADTWTDDGYPARVLDALYQLLTPAGRSHPTLYAVEVATLIAAPFLREAILTLGFYDVPQVLPRDFNRLFGTGFRCDLENMFANHEQLTRRASGLAETRPADRDILSMWLVHRWILEREDLWEGKNARTAAIDLARAILTATGLHVGEGRTKEQGQLLLSVIRCITTILGPEDERLDPKASDAVRARPLGYLLSIAGVLGADPRRMSAVLVDHIGTYDAVGLDQLHDVLATEVTWRQDGDELVVDAVCGHPAVHVALADLAEEADAACTIARRASVNMPENERNLLIGVPARCGENLRPEGSAYDKPLLRFHLAGDRIRDLLMGSQLYGDDAAVAVRELYQNALDACRYRHMRLRCEHQSESQLNWQGKITLRQGVERETGRRYIECEDNGVGMTESVLRHAFTAAGTRFVHTEAFRREEARWRQVDPTYRLYPNSQFGIGVFSYFMLADEVSVWTAATDDHGLGVESRLHLHIPGPGGLLRLRRDEVMPEGIKGIRSGGTTVRIYLSGGLEVSAAETLTDYLVVSDYQVEVWHDERLVRQWLPGIPEYPRSVDARPQAGANQVWWIDGPGLMLSDGLTVGRRKQVSNLGMYFIEPNAVWTKNMFGRMINLTGPYQPRLSIDRTSMLDWDRDWVERQVQASVPTLDSWSGFTWTWLWSLTRDDATLAQTVFDQHSDREIPLDSEPGSPTAKIGDIGSFPEDANLFDKLTDPQQDWYFLTPWRLSLWRRVTDRLNRSLTDTVGPDITTGFPTVTPTDVDALTCLKGMDEYIRQNRNVSTPSAIEFKITKQALLYHLRRFVIAGLDLRLLRSVNDNGNPQMVAAAVGVTNIPSSVPLPVQLLMIAIYTRKSLGEIAEQFRDYAVGQGYILPVPSGPDLVPSFQDLYIVSRDVDGIAPWHTELSEWAVRVAAERIQEPIESVHDRIVAYTRVGFFYVPMHAPEPPSADDPTAEALYNVLKDLTGPPAGAAITDLAFNLQVSEKNAFEMVAEATERLGMTISAEFANSFPSDVPTSSDYNLIRERRPLSLAAVMRHRREYLPDTPSAQAAEFFRRNAHMLNVPEQITAAHLVVLAADLGTSISHAVSVVHELFPEQLNLADTKTIPESLASLRPSLLEAEVLVEADDEKAIWRSPSAAMIVNLGVATDRTIGEVLETLSAYRQLGAQVPEFISDLVEYQPDSNDGLALGMVIPTPDQTVVTHLRLVLVAGRNGWTVRYAFERLNRFRPLGVILQSSAEQCPDTIVNWADIIVLSQNFDGYEPALSGVVNASRIAHAADIVRESPAETRARLMQYADLFGLEFEELS